MDTATVRITVTGVPVDVVNNLITNVRHWTMTHGLPGKGQIITEYVDEYQPLVDGDIIQPNDEIQLGIGWSQHDGVCNGYKYMTNVFKPMRRKVVDPLEEAAEALLDKYVATINSGDCGNWDPETEEEVINLRKALSQQP